MKPITIVKKYEKELKDLYHHSSWDPLSLNGHYGTALKVFEAQTLYSIIKHKKYRDVLEIGTAEGFSALYMCKALEASKRPVSFDTVDKRPFPQKLARNLLSDQGVDTSFVNFICEDSKVAIPALNKQYDMCLIDGSHDYSGTKKDLINVIPKIKKGGCIVLDDIQPTITKDTPYWVWKEVLNGDIFEEKIRTYELGSKLCDFFSYDYDLNECENLERKWKRKSWILDETNPKATVGVIFKK